MKRIIEYRQKSSITINIVNLVKIHRIRYVSYPLLLNVYGRCSLQQSVRLFREISHKDMITSCAMMKVYLNHNDSLQALQLFDEINPSERDDICYLLALKACIQSNNNQTGIHIIQQLRSCKSPNAMSTQLKTSLIRFYGYFGDIQAAWRVFNNDIAYNEKDTIVYNAMMSALNDHKQYADTLNMYDSMQTKNDVSHTLAIKACVHCGDLEKGKQIHSTSIHATSSIRAKTALIDLYGNAGDLRLATNVFDSMQSKSESVSAVTINCMMNAYINNDETQKALDLYLRQNPIDEDCHVLALKACCNLQEYEQGKSIIDECVLPENQMSINMKNTLIRFYGNMSDIENAWKVFQSMSESQVDIVSVTAMMNAYCINQRYSDCIDLFKQIGCSGTKYRYLQPDIVCYVTLFAACLHGEQFAVGQYIHATLRSHARYQWVLRHSDIQMSLINMYSKHGCVAECEQIFSDIKRTQYDKYCNEIAIWNVMLNAYAKNAQIEQVKRLYHEIRNNDELNLVADRLTYIAVIHAFGHCGDENEAYQVWLNHITDLSMKYDVFLMNSVIDGFSRKGNIFKAMELIKEYETYHQHAGHRKADYCDAAMWISVLNGCRIHKETQFAEHVYNELTTRFAGDAKYESAINASGLLMQSVRGEW